MNLFNIFIAKNYSVALDVTKDTQFIELYVQFMYSSKIFPEGREQFTFSYENGEAILFGGMITNKSNKMWKFNPAKNSWSTINCENTTTVNPQRSGHTAILQQKKLYVFGGKSKVHSMYVLQDLEIFDLENNTWNFPSCPSKNFLKLRRNHVAVIVGNNRNKYIIIIY